MRFIFLLVVVLLSAHARAQVPQAFLVQNSGWMEPFYLDSSSRLKPLVREVVKASAEKSPQIMLASFNQSAAATNNQSPRSVYIGAPTERAVVDALAQITLSEKSRKPVSYYDTDFFEMIEKTVGQFFQQKPGIIWVFTNNKNSPGNDQNTKARNRDYYQFLHTDKSITQVLAFPVPMPVQGKLYSANALMVYAIAYGEAASIELSQIIASGRVDKVLGGAAARVKPLNQNIVAFYPTAAKQGAGVRVQQTKDGQLVFTFEGGRKAVTAEFSGQFKGLVHPYEIASANLSATLNTDKQSVEINAQPAQLTRIRPGVASSEVNLSFAVPALPGYFSPDVLLKEGVSQRAELKVVLANQTLALTPTFANEMRALFPEDPLMEIFSSAPMPRESTTTVPVTIFVLHPTWPLITALIASCVALFGGLWLLTSMLRTPEYLLLVDGATRKVRMKTNSRYAVTDMQGNAVATLTRGRFGKPSLSEIAPGHSVTLK